MGNVLAMLQSFFIENTEGFVNRLGFTLDFFIYLDEFLVKLLPVVRVIEVLELGLNVNIL